MGDIKSALEIAKEKIAKLGEPTAKERLEWKYTPEGEKLAARYLKRDANLTTELNKFEEKNREFVARGAAEVLIRNINLPKNDPAKQANRLVMDGLKALKNDKVAVENVYSQLRRLFNHYTEQGEQQRKQAYERLKAEFEARIQQAAQQQLNLLARGRINVEREPQFREEWHRLLAQLDSQYLRILGEYKQQLRELS